MPVLAIDLGGTKLATAVVDHQGQLHSLEKHPVVHISPAATLEQMVAQCHVAVKSSGIEWSEISRVGLIVPGVADDAVAGDVLGLGEGLGGEDRGVLGEVIVDVEAIEVGLQVHVGLRAKEV